MIRYCMLLGCSLLLLSVGCGRPAAEVGTASPSPSHAHAHDSVGPHGGDLVELGDDEYHAEVVHDDAAGTVTVYVLDANAKERMPVDAGEVTINVKTGRKPKQFSLPAAPLAEDAAQRASRFQVADRDLAEALEEAARAEIVVEIEGVPYRGRIAHAHDHGEPPNHDHSHPH